MATAGGPREGANSSGGIAEVHQGTGVDLSGVSRSPRKSPRRSPRKSPRKSFSKTLSDLSRCDHSMSNAYSQGFPSTPRRRDDLERIQQRVVTAATRGVLMGMTMRGGFHVLSYALRLVVAGQGGAMKNRGVSEMPGGGGGVGRTAVVTAASVKTVLRKILKDTLQYGMFLGSFSGGYVALEEGIALGLGRERTRGWRALVAGFVAGGSLVLAGGDKRHTSLALYMALKGLTFLVRCGNVPLVIGSEPRDVHGGSGNCGDVRGKDGVQKPSSNNETERKKTRRAWVRRLLAPTRFSQGDVLLMCLAMSQLGFSWIVEPSTLPGSMLKFLNKHGGQSARTMDEIRVMCTTDRNPLVVSGGPDLTARLSPSMRPSQEAYARAIPVYLPVYIIPALLIHRQRLLSDPEIWPKIVKGTLRSSLFLSLFCTLAWKSVCTAFKWHGRASGAIVASSCWVAGLALLAEKKSRRMELSIYAMSRALESFGHCLVAWGYLPQRTPRTRSSWKLQPRTDVILFSMAAAAICHCYSDHDGQRRDVFGGKYLNFFDFMFGNTGFDNKGRIRHVPTNRDLVALAGERMRRITKSIGNDLASLSMTSSVEDESDDDDVWTESSSSDDDELL